MALEKVCHQSERHRWYDRLPASPAVQVGELLFIGGQVALDGDGRPVAPGDVRAQAKYAFERMRELVQAAGGGMDDVVDIISLHKDAREMDTVFEVAREFFTSDYPAWTAVASTGFQEPELLVSIRAIAHLGAGEKECFTPETIRWVRRFPMSGGCKKGDLLFVSGQMGADADGYITRPGDHGAQAQYAFRRIQEIVEMAGGSMDDVIDLIGFNRDPRGMDAAVDVWLQEVVADVARENAPTVTTIGTPGLYRLGLLGAYRAIADFSPGPRVAHCPPSIWWHALPDRRAGRKKRAGA